MLRSAAGPPAIMEERSNVTNSSMLTNPASAGPPPGCPHPLARRRFPSALV